LLFASAIGSEHLIAVSNATKSDLLRYYPIPPRKITVVPHGVDERMFTLPRRPRGYLLCVSTLHPHKNIERLIRVFARLRASHPGLRLVLAGMRGFHTQAIEQAAASLQDSVDITGWIERERLYELYAGADAFVYPSTFEGFGMPVLEALAAGIPTACSDIEPLRSMAGGAAVLFHPHKDRSMLEALERVLQSRTSRGPARAHQFSWDAAARATLKALSTAAGLPTES
jgi:glycosyltransferase involved in cell wall biosynthesis